jgi:PKHD-type hydroxylase
MNPSRLFLEHERFKTIDYSNYYYFTNVLTEEEILKLKTIGESLFKEKGTVTDQGNETSARISEVSWIDSNENTLWLYEKIAGLVITANESMWQFDLSGYHDSLQYTTYNGGGGHYDWHTDVGPKMANRKISCVLQLSNTDEYTGGDLQLNGGNGVIDAPKDYNTLIIFPSFVLHRVTPVLTGTRKSLVTWLAGPTLK